MLFARSSGGVPGAAAAGDGQAVGVLAGVAVGHAVEVGVAVTDMAAHEFFHIVTPLNIHSEIIEHFNFATPTPSQHLWLTG